MREIKKVAILGAGAMGAYFSRMNGLESEEYIGSIYGMDKMLYAVTVGIDAAGY